MFLSVILAAVIPLNGVVGSGLRARAFFDANNVKVGDPLILTVDFLGEADFRNLHPPALSRALDRRDWKLDDASAKTDTFRDARRLTYRVRPMRRGLLTFPELTFGYAAPDGSARTVRANAIPAHVKRGAQVVVAGMDAVETTGDGMPAPPALRLEPALEGETLSLDDDTLFAWRRACAKPTADGFKPFDFPAARLNEARQAILEGNWARALSVYGKLEWTLGQTPEIERGVLAALARRYDNPDAELPVWRQVGRPLLKFAWAGRVGIVLGAFLAVALVMFLVSRGIRAVACLALALLAPSLASAQGGFDPFAEMRQMQERMRRQMQQMSSGGGFSFGFGNGFGGEEERPAVKVTASVAVDGRRQEVGSPFAFIVSIEAPKTASLGEIRLTPSETFGMTVTGEVENMTDGRSANASNVVKRLSVPVRYDVPFKGPVSFRVEGMATSRASRRGGRFSFTYSSSFACDAAPVLVDVKPLSGAGQPPDFSGIVSEGLVLSERVDLRRVETNDVVTVTYRLLPKGYVPAGYMLPDAAYEWTAERDRAGRATLLEFRRYVVADGRAATPKVSVAYYDPRTKRYARATVGGTPLHYVPSTETEEQDVRQKHD